MKNPKIPEKPVQVKCMELRDDALAALIRQSVARAVQRQMEAPCGLLPEADGRKKILVLVPELAVGLRRTMERLEKRHAGCLLCVCSVPRIPLQDGAVGLDIRKEAVQAEIMDGLSGFEGIDVVQPGIGLMEKTIQCREECFAVKTVLAGLLRKIRVGYELGFDPADAGALSERMTGLAQSVRAMGIRVSFPDSGHLGAEKEGRAESGLVTRQDVEEMWKAGVRELRRDGKCVITPLAKDRIRELGIRVLPI